MFGKSSVFTMLLIVTASLVGISSVYKPANIETQPMQLQTQQLPGDQEPLITREQSGKALQVIFNL